jgi:phenylacetate-CoA ligase
MSLRDLVSFARERSSYYRELYKSLPANLPADSELRRILPLTVSSDYWAANTLENNRLLTGPMHDGIVFKSGGTTGAPKFSIFNREEWAHFCQTFGRGLVAGGLQSGERVGNLFYAGELYASFLFILKSFESAANASLHFPLSGTASSETVMKTLVDFELTTLAGTPTSLVQLAETLHEQGSKVPRLKRLLFGGESLYPDQRERLAQIFPGVKVQSIGYASVDAGLLGFWDESCAGDEHRAFGAETIYEIIDENTGAVIEDVGVEGKAYVTYLARRLMPVIRYPVGDRAMWSEPKGVSLDRRFKLLGRSDEGARVGPVSVFFDDVYEAFHAEGVQLVGLQLVTKHFDHRDQLIVRLVPAQAQSAQNLIELLLKARPMLSSEVQKGNIHRPAVEIVAMDGLEKNQRTGKTKRVIDLRLK